MKKISVLLLGLSAIPVAQACNWNAENCTYYMQEEVQRQIGALKQNPKFMQEKFGELQQMAQRIDRKTASCSSWRCTNDAWSEFNNYVSQLTLNYVINKPKASPVAPAAPTDKWANQCVVGKTVKAPIYRDAEGIQAIGNLDYSAYAVSQTNGGKLVGLKSVPDYGQPNPEANAGKFIGWVKKADLQMQDLRNCN